MVNIVDLIFIAFVIISVIRCYKKGFALSCVQACSVAVSGFASFKLLEPVSRWLYNLFVDKWLTASLADVVKEAGSGVNIKEKLDVMLSSLPEGAVKLAQGIGIDSEGLMDKLKLNSFSNETALVEAFKTEIAYPIVIFLVEIIVFILLMIIISTILGLICGLFVSLLKKIPIVGKADKLLGAALGVVKAVVSLIIVTTFFYIILTVSKDDSSLKIIGDSYIYQLLSEYNPLISSI